jgi:hypothetical protein
MAYIKTTLPAFFDLGAHPVDLQAMQELRVYPEFVPKGAERYPPVFDAQPPLAAPPPGQPNFTGLVRERLRVVGYGYRRPNKKTSSEAHMWVCRCVCGRYVYRRSKALRVRKRDEIPDACPFCRDLIYKQKIDKAQQAKKYKDGSPFIE